MTKLLKRLVLVVVSAVLFTQAAHAVTVDKLTTNDTTPTITGTLITASETLDSVTVNGVATNTPVVSGNTWSAQVGVLQVVATTPVITGTAGLAFGRANADGSPNYTRQNITYQIQTSADGTNWTAQTMYQGGYGQSSVSETQTLTTKQSTSDVLIKNNPTGVRYIRVNITDAANQHFGILRFSYNNNG